MMNFLLILFLSVFAETGSEFLKNAEFFDAFRVFNESQTSLEGEELKNAALSDFHVRRFDLAAKTFEKIPFQERVESNLEPIYIESLIRIGKRKKAIAEASALADFPLTERIKAARVFSYFGMKALTVSLIGTIDPKTIPLEAYNDYARVLIYSFEYEKARELIKSKEYFFNSNPEGLLTQSILLIRESKQNDAMSLAEKAGALSPNNPEILTFIDEHEGRLSILSDQLQFLETRLSTNPTATLKMNYLRTLVNAGLLQKEDKEAQGKTLAEASIIIKELENKIDAPEFFVLKGIVAWQLGKEDEGIEALKTAITEDKSDGLAYQILSLIYLNNKDFENAALILKKGLPYSYQDSSYYLQLSKVYTALHNNEEALKKIEHALKISPANATLLSNEGEVLFNLRNYEEALAVITEALKINPKDSLALKIKKQLEDRQ